jgi:hypothetical protein
MSKIITEVEALDLMSQLGKELVTSYEAEDATVDTIITALLAFQVLTPAITKGTISGDYSGLTRSIKVDGDTILRALFRLRDTVGGYIYVDNDRKLQWASSLGEDKGQQIRYRKNLKGIERNIDYASLINRLYCYGSGEGTARIKLSDVESALTANAASGQKDVAVTDASLFAASDPVVISDDNASENNAIASIAGNTLTMTTNLANTYTTAANGKVNRKEDYIEDTDSQTEWGGIYVGVMVDRSITHPDTLLAWANLKLAEVKDPLITYQIDTVDLSESTETDFSFDSLQLGSTVKVIDEDLGIDVSVAVVKIEHPDLLHPERMYLELATRVKDIANTLVEVYDRQQFDHHIATTIGAGQVIVKGTFTVLDWATGGETTIRGDYITTGTVVLGALAFVPLSSTGATGEIVATINATAEGIVIDANKVSVNAGKRIYKQAAIPTSNSEGDLWFDTDDENKLYRAACAGADEITAGEWELVRDTLTTTNAASIVVNSDNITLNVTDISNLDGRVTVNEADIVINSDAITLEVTNRTSADSTLQGSITVNANNIALKVSKNDVINQINISTEGIMIDADNITLGGVVQVTDDIKSSNYSAGVSGWVIDGGGSAELNNVTVRGNIQAQAGSSISAGYLTGGTITGKTIIISGATGILKSSNYSAGSAGWQIEGDGDAEFNDVKVRGTIYTSSIASGNTLTVTGTLSAGGGNVIIDSSHLKVIGNKLDFYDGAALAGRIYGDSDGFRIYSPARAVGKAEIVFAPQHDPGNYSYIAPDEANNYYLGISSYYWRRVYSGRYFSKVEYWDTFDEHDDIKLLKDIKRDADGYLDLNTFPQGIVETDEDLQHELDDMVAKCELLKRRYDLPLAQVNAQIHERMTTATKSLSIRGIDVGAWQSFLMGTIKQLVDKVDSLEARIA